MVTIDLVGLAATILVVGLRYPHYVLLATFIHDLSQIFALILAHGQFNYMVTAGAFGTMAFNYNELGIIGFLLLFSGSLANYMMSSMTGGIVFEPTKCLVNPLASLRAPFSVINFRLCLVTSLVQVWKIFI